MDNCNLQLKGVQRLSSELKSNSVLRSLGNCLLSDLSDNLVSSEGAVVIAEEIIRNKAITSLSDDVTKI
jgi:hypothetical protein